MAPRRLLLAMCSAAAAVLSLGAAVDDSIPAVLVSRQLAVAERLEVGSVITLATDRSGTNARQFRVAGSYEPVPDPMRLGAVRQEVRMHLPNLIALTGDPADPASAESIDALNVATADQQSAESFAKSLATRFPGVYGRTTSVGEERAAPFVVLERFHLAIAIVTVIASSIFLLALMLMLVDERRSTVGILRLIGYRRRRILLYVLIEGLMIAAAGAVIGIVIAAAFQGGVNQFFQWRYDTALVFVRITPAIALRSIAIAVPLGVLAATGSSWTLLQREVFALTRR